MSRTFSADCFFCDVLFLVAYGIVSLTTRLPLTKTSFDSDIVVAIISNIRLLTLTEICLLTCH